MKIKIQIKLKYKEFKSLLYAVPASLIYRIFLLHKRFHYKALEHYITFD